MNQKWWEPVVRFINDWWFVWLPFIILGFTAFFTRDYWMPLLGL